MDCSYCTHKAVCFTLTEVGEEMINTLMSAFPAVNIATAKAATFYTMASLCPHYRMEEKDSISITIVSGD